MTKKFPKKRSKSQVKLKGKKKTAATPPPAEMDSEDDREMEDIAGGGASDNEVEDPLGVSIPHYVLRL